MIRPSRCRLAPFCPNLGVTLLLLGAPSRATAQYPAPPPPAPEEPRAPEATEEQDASTTALRRPEWRFSLAVLGGYETNIDFRAPEVDDWAGAVRGSLGRSWLWPRGQFSFSLNGTGVRYFEERAASRGDGSASLAWSQRLSRRVRFSLVGSGAAGSTTSQAFLTDLAQVLPRSRAWNYGSSGAFDFRLGQQSSFRLSGGYGRVTFDDPALVDAQGIIGQAALSRKIGANDSIALSYGYQRTENENLEPLDNHTGTLTWGRKLSRRVSLSLAGGAGYNPPVAGALEQAWYFQGSLGLTGAWRRATLSLHVGQSVTPAYGLVGNQISDSASLSAVLPLGRRSQLSFGGGHTWARSRSGNQIPYNNDYGTLTLGIGLSRHAGMELSYGYRRTKPEDAPVTEAQQGYFGFTYSLP